VGDVQRDLIRWGALVDGVLGTWTPEARWVGWMVYLGADPDEVDWDSAWGTAPDFARCRDLDVALARGPDAWRTGTSPAGAERLRATLGDDLDAFLTASAERARIGIRLPRKAPRDRVVKRLRAADVDARASELVAHGVTVPPSSDLRALRLPRGWEVQDEASQLVATLAAVEGRVLDVCAGAGGKSLALADLGCQVVAGDVRKRALDELRRRAGAARLRIQTKLWGEGEPTPALGTFDAVLVDAPCSGSGVWRRHPEYRYRLDDLEGLTSLQDILLARAAPLVAPGGRLVFATCSVLDDEGRDRTEAFLAAHDDFERARPDVVLAPNTTDTDGFYASVLVRR
jgi:16S rRNA (cytosine967-C5)-methyltransferase